MITVHVDIVETGETMKFRPYVSGIPTKREQDVGRRVVALLMEAMGEKVESPKEVPAPKSKPRRRRK